MMLDTLQYIAHEIHMETSFLPEQEICELVISQLVNEGNGGTMGLILSCARIFGLAKKLQIAPSLDMVKNFLKSYESKLPSQLLEYISNVYEGKIEIPVHPKHHDKYFSQTSDHFTIVTKVLKDLEGPGYELRESNLKQMVRVFVRLECQIKCDL